MKALWQITKAEMHRTLTPDEISQITDIHGDFGVGTIQYGTLGKFRVMKGGIKETGWQIQPKISELVDRINAIEQAIADGLPVPKDIVNEYNNRPRI